MKHSPFLLETSLSWLRGKAREYQIPLIASFLFGMLAYAFTFTNKLINHDEAYCLFEKGATVDSGRWGLEITEYLFPNFSMPWIYGILTLALIAAAVCILVHIFEIRNRVLQVLLAGSIVVFPSLISTFAYMFTSTSFGLSFFLAVLAVDLMRRPSKVSVLAAVGCMVLSLSIYQAYISLAAGLLVLILIQRLLREDDVQSVVRQGVGFLLFLILSLGLYYMATRLILHITGRGFNGYASENMSFSLLALPGKAGVAYLSFIRFFREGFQGLMPTALSRLLHTVLLAAVVLFLAIWGRARKEKKWQSLLLLAALLSILPLAINCMYLFTTADSVHTLVLYGFVSFYVLAVILADECIDILPMSRLTALVRRISLEAVTLSMALILISNIYTSNAISLRLYLRYENAHAFYTALAANIQRSPGFDENTRLAVVGNYQSPGFYSDHFSDISPTGTTGFLPSNYSNGRFLEYYIGFPIPLASPEEILEITASPAFTRMPVYPYYGSMQFFGDVLVVKLS